MAIDFVEIGSRLRLAREHRGWTQAQLAKKLSVTPQYVSLIEKGRVKATAATLDAMADLLGLPFLLHVGRHGDDRASIVVRLDRVLDHLEPSVVDTLTAWVDLWERKHLTDSAKAGVNR